MFDRHAHALWWFPDGRPVGDRSRPRSADGACPVIPGRRRSSTSSAICSRATRAGVWPAAAARRDGRERRERERRCGAAAAPGCPQRARRRRADPPPPRAPLTGARGGAVHPTSPAGSSTCSGTQDLRPGAPESLRGAPACSIVGPRPSASSLSRRSDLSLRLRTRRSVTGLKTSAVSGSPASSTIRTRVPSACGTRSRVTSAVPSGRALVRSFSRCGTVERRPQRLTRAWQRGRLQRPHVKNRVVLREGKEQ